MNTLDLFDTFSEFKELKNIDRKTMMRILEDAFRSVLVKQYESDDNFDVIINIDKGDFEIWRNREVVEDKDFSEPNTQITLTDAQKIDEDYEVGEEVSEEVKFTSFPRRSILTLRQTLASKIMDLEKGNIYLKYKDRVGEIVNGEVYQVWKKEILVLDDEGNELIIPKSEQIPSDYFRKGDNLRAVVIRVEMKNNNPLIILSRTSNLFLEKLFEIEVPEIFDGLITIKNIVRVPGERAKVAVESYDERIDPVGACVGMKGSRIHGIVRELRNENIDVINYSSNTQLYIQRALSPAKVVSIKLLDDLGQANVYLDPDQVSLAIGKGGLNIKLAGELSGYKIEAYRDIPDDEEDVDLDEFADEFDSWVIDSLKAIGCDTAKSVLELSAKELEKRTDLEVESIEYILSTLKEEFED